MVRRPLQPRACDPLTRDRASRERLSRGPVIIDFASYSLSFSFRLEFVDTVFLCCLNAIRRVGRFYSACFRGHEPGQVRAPKW